MFFPRPHLTLPPKRPLTQEQDIRLALADAFLHELDEMIDRMHSGQVVYRPLSPLWTAESREIRTPELDDPVRHQPPPGSGGSNLLGV